MKSARIAAVVFAVAVACAVADEARAQSPEDLAVARELFREGTTALAAESWSLARTKLERSLALKRSSLTLYYLAVAEERSGALVAALDSYRAFTMFPRSAKSAHLFPEARAAIAKLEGRVGRIALRIEPRPHGIEVTIDDVAVPDDELASRLVDPGVHRVRVSAAGHVPFVTQIDVAEGRSVDVDVRLAPVPAAPAAASPPAVEAAPSSALPLSLIIGGGVVATTGLAVGVAGLVEANGAREGTSEADRARAMGVTADVLVPSGLVALGVGAILTLVSNPSDGRGDVGRVAPWSSGAAGGVRLGF